MADPFDALSKDVLHALLDPRLAIRFEHRVAHEPQFVDAWTSPPARPADVLEIGLLGRMVVGRRALLEPFSCTVTARHVRGCLRKQLALDHQQLEEAARPRPGGAEGRARATLPELPRLWVISVGDPVRLRRRMGARHPAGWPRGIFRTADFFEMWLVVLEQLPAERGTLPLRLMGRGQVFLEAVEQLTELASSDPLREPLQAVLVRRRVRVDPMRATEEEREYERVTQTLFEEFQARLLAEGELKGELKGKREGKLEGELSRLRQAIEDLCEVLEIRLDARRRKHMGGLDVAGLDELRLHLKTHRAWPSRKVRS